MEYLQENGLYLLFAGAMLFLMFRHGGCCGGHSNHGHGGNAHGGGCGGAHSNSDDSSNNNSSDDKVVKLVKDPVCGMNIDPSIAIHEIIDGKSYYFCSEKCREEFLRR